MAQELRPQDQTLFNEVDSEHYVNDTKSPCSGTIGSMLNDPEPFLAPQEHRVQLHFQELQRVSDMNIAVVNLFSQERVW
jgi:hypothetical protein